jgi:transcriptional regulator with XRE-family HTH domain
VDRGTFGQWLDTTMENRGIQGQDLAKKLGVTDGAISRWRTGQSIPKMNMLRDLAATLDVDMLGLMALADVPGMKENGVEPLANPAPNKRREMARQELKRIKHLDRAERQALIEAYDRIVRDLDGKEDSQENKGAE